jgi:hypothetical protein
MLARDKYARKRNRLDNERQPPPIFPRSRDGLPFACPMINRLTLAAVPALLLSVVTGGCKPTGEVRPYARDAGDSGVMGADSKAQLENGVPKVSVHMLGQARLPSFTAKELADAKRWGVAPDSTDFFLLEASAYRHERGEMNPVGSPLAGGGVVGRDDWWSVVRAAHGAPTQVDKDRKRQREQLYLVEMPRRDPISDAKLAANRHDWRLYMGVWGPRLTPATDSPYRPLRFAAWGLLEVFGCRITEDQFREKARRTWYDYYDVHNSIMYVLAQRTDIGSFALEIDGVLSNNIVNYSGSPEIYYNYKGDNYNNNFDISYNPKEYHSIYNRTLYDLSRRSGHDFELPQPEKGDCGRFLGPL